MSPPFAQFHLATPQDSIKITTPSHPEIKKISVKINPEANDNDEHSPNCICQHKKEIIFIYRE